MKKYSSVIIIVIFALLLSGGNDSMSMDGYGNNSGEDIAGGIWKHVPAGV